MPTVHARTLKRAAQIVGGVEELAVQLDVTSAVVAEWSEGKRSVPEEIFLKAVDIVSAHELNEISGKHRIIKPSPSADR